MQRLITLFALILALAATPACLMAGETLPRPEALSEETIYLTEKLSKSYDTIVIRNFTADKAQYERVDSDERVTLDKMTPSLLNTIADSLEAELKARKLFTKVIRNSQPSGKAVVLEGELIEFNAGSRALKMFVGFGAGKAYLKSKGRLLDAQSGKELAVFEDRETGYLGSMSALSFEVLFPSQAKSMGENLALFLEKLY